MDADRGSSVEEKQDPHDSEQKIGSSLTDQGRETDNIIGD